MYLQPGNPPKQSSYLKMEIVLNLQIGGLSHSVQPSLNYLQVALLVESLTGLLPIKSFALLKRVLCLMTGLSKITMSSNRFNNPLENPKTKNYVLPPLTSQMRLAVFLTKQLSVQSIIQVQAKRPKISSLLFYLTYLLMPLYLLGNSVQFLSPVVSDKVIH